MKLCTEGKICLSIDTEICSQYEPEPSEYGERGQIICTGYCAKCGHTDECHEELSEDRVREILKEKEQEFSP